MRKTIVDFADRVGSTFAQAFVGSLGAAQIVGLGDVKSALVAAVGAAIVAVVKVVGVQAAALNSPAATVAVDDVVKSIAAKLQSPK
jgi:hypothetical protein